MSDKTPFTCLSARRSGVLEFSDTFVDGETLLVPGVPEAKCDMDAVDAFVAWRKWFRDCATRRGVEMVMWGGPAS